MSKPIKTILVVGGGTAGWLTACILAKKLNVSQQNKFCIRLIESPEIARIGVGEGTVPTMRETLKLIGVSETEFIRQCDATFKQSIDFVDWTRNATTGEPQSYYHLFNYPHSPKLDMAPFWYAGLAPQATSYADAVTIQARLCALNKGPKKITTAEYLGVADYAYHLDATKFADFLTEHGTKTLGIQLTRSHIQSVTKAKDGSIQALHTADGVVIEADFFVDCSGFASLLIGEALGIPFVDKKDVLFVDHALALQLPYSKPDSPIPSHTIATAQQAGWIWDIGLSARRGTGYVYSSQFTSHQQAEIDFRAYLGPAADQLSMRTIPMRIGYRKEFFHKNCIAIGLAAGFVEPLEATAIMLVEATAKMLADLMPVETAALDVVAKKMNKTIQYSWDRVIDFIKLHYYLSNRTDNDFWFENRNENSVPDSLKEKIELWKYNYPSLHDFPTRYEVFSLENYKYVLYGMGFSHCSEFIGYNEEQEKYVVEEFLKLNKYKESIVDAMPSHRDLIDRIKKYGLQSI